MIKLPKYLIRGLFYICILLALTHLILIFTNDGSLDFFKNANGFFLSISISSVFLSLYQKEEKNNNKFSFMRLPISTLIIMLVEGFVIVLFIRKIITHGFLNREMLFWQISSCVLVIVSILQLISIHIEMLNKRK